MSSIEETESAQERQGSPPQHQQQQQQQQQHQNDTQINDQRTDSGKMNASAEAQVDNNKTDKSIDRATIEMSDKGSIKKSDKTQNQDSIRMSDKNLNRGSKEMPNLDNHRGSLDMFDKNNKRNSSEMFDKIPKRESTEMSEFRSKKLRRSIFLPQERYECVTCRTPFEFSQDLLEHLSGNPAGKSGAETNRKCYVRECFMCDYAPAPGNADLVAMYRALQDHVITTHFKASLPHLMTPPLKSGNDSKTEQKSGGVKKPEHMCRKCGKQFPEERQLLNHLSLLCAVVVQCDLCTFNFDRVENLASHVRTFHLKTTSTSTLKSDDKLDEDKQVIDRQTTLVGKYTFRCSLCGKVFMSEELVRNHKNIFHSNKIQGSSSRAQPQLFKHL